MKRKTKCVAAMLAACLLMALTGCGGKQTPAPQPPTVTDPPGSETTQPEAPAAQPGGETEPDDQVIYVSSTEELLDAIAPNAQIVLEPGYYNMSEYLEWIWDLEGEDWNELHPYVRLQECYDGVEVVIQQVDGLSLSGGGTAPGDTEVVIDPRYGAVMTFEQCYDLALSNLTMGHTQTGDCSGNVLDFANCRNIELDEMDLYGCGVYGIGTSEGTGELYVSDSVIRDCSYGPLDLWDGGGRFEFRNCSLVDSESYAWYEKTPYSELAFYECEFGDNETSYFMFHEDVYTEDCIWSENYTYPDYSDVEDAENWVIYDPDTMQAGVINKEFLDDTAWTGYAMVNPESGEEVFLPYEDYDGTVVSIHVALFADGTGWFEDEAENRDVVWGEDRDYAWLEFSDGRIYYLTPFTMNDGYHSTDWLLLEMEECLVWLYMS